METESGRGMREGVPLKTPFFGRLYPRRPCTRLVPRIPLFCRPRALSLYVYIMSLSLTGDSMS